MDVSSSVCGLSVPPGQQNKVSNQLHLRVQQHSGIDRLGRSRRTGYAEPQSGVAPLQGDLVGDPFGFRGAVHLSVQTEQRRHLSDHTIRRVGWFLFGGRRTVELFHGVLRPDIRRRRGGHRLCYDTCGTRTEALRTLSRRRARKSDSESPSGRAARESLGRQIAAADVRLFLAIRRVFIIF